MSAAHSRRRSESLNIASITSPSARALIANISSCAASKSFGFAHVRRRKSGAAIPNSFAARVMSP
jgi:hypothetical protein